MCLFFKRKRPYDDSKDKREIIKQIKNYSFLAFKENCDIEPLDLIISELRKQKLTQEEVKNIFNFLEYIKREAKSDEAIRYFVKEVHEMFWNKKNTNNVKEVKNNTQDIKTEVDAQSKSLQNAIIEKEMKSRTIDLSIQKAKEKGDYVTLSQLLRKKSLNDATLAKLRNSQNKLEARVDQKETVNVLKEIEETNNLLTGEGLKIDHDKVDEIVATDDTTTEMVNDDSDFLNFTLGQNNNEDDYLEAAKREIEDYNMSQLDTRVEERKLREKEKEENK